MLVHLHINRSTDITLIRSRETTWKDCTILWIWFQLEHGTETDEKLAGKWLSFQSANGDFENKCLCDSVQVFYFVCSAYNAQKYDWKI